MKILHLNSNFLFTKIYENQINSMSPDFEHIVYNPLRKNVDNHTNINVLKPVNLNKIDSILSLKRLFKSYKYLKNNINLNQINITHAHTLTNDGLLALRLYKRNKIPYILTIRNTDINFSLKYKKHLKNQFLNVIMSAKNVIFPNYSYKHKLLEAFKNNSKLEKKLSEALVIPNGIDKLWINNPYQKEKTINQKNVKILFIGRIYSNKNLHTLLEALNNIENCELTVVGNIIDTNYFDELNKKYNFNYIGEKTKEELIDIMKHHHIFAMPSFNETFGLVYIEALSQNLPVLYTKNEGIYNYFEDKKYGVAVQPNDVKNVNDGLEFIIHNYQTLQNNLKDKSFLYDFDWNNIGRVYEKLYLGEYNG